MSEEVTEEWRPITELDGRFSVSSLGRIRREYATSRSKCGQIVPSHLGKNGYPIVTFYLGKTPEGKNRQITRYVHSLVAREFIGERPEGYDVCHNDGDKTNNTPSNLRYDTRSGNCRDKILHGTSGRGSGRLTRNEAAAVLLLTRDGHRQHAIAKFLGVPPGTVKSVVKGHSFGWLNVEITEES